ncbi:GLPGLI family protein [Myroides sp. M-43]|uniref:GLPGLI family protein n=1 Tax=Myroides oncorhynchi TaxID=2893756 RepID=UPI001E620BDB|nr:GLPGLI family protein [Myroides oncorhynchi]MCC9043060.1 GLPGLI family protein [Myroides oncorhynchi]
MKFLVIPLLTLLFFCNCLAQEKKDFMRYEYILTYKPYDLKVMPDSLPITEKFYLDVEGSNSVFVSDLSYSEFVSDVIGEEYKGKESKITWLVTKDSKEMSLNEVLNYLEFYKVKQPLNLIKWTITNETEDYHGMKVQKATGELSGRIWTVWFTTEISIIEGPYKFKNLPGFVVKAQDSNQDYIFEFTESMRVNNYWVEMGGYDKYKEITDKQLKRIKTLNANKNLIQVLRERGSKLMNDDKEPSDFMTKKFGKEPNPIEFY